ATCSPAPARLTSWRTLSRPEPGSFIRSCSSPNQAAIVSSAVEQPGHGKGPVAVVPRGHHSPPAVSEAVPDQSGSRYQAGKAEVLFATLAEPNHPAALV